MASAPRLGGGEVTLDSCFEVDFNMPLVHETVRAELNARRQGTSSTKTRGMVSGGGAKPWRQKGTGRARQGSIRAPQHTGGGIVHGPHPRDYSQRTPKKMIAAALLGVLSDRARGERLHVIENFGTSGPSTKNASALLADVATSKNVLIVLERGDDDTFKSVRNLKHVHVLFADQLNAYDVVVSDDIVFTKAAFDSFVQAKVSTGSTNAGSTNAGSTSAGSTNDEEAGK